MNGRQSRTLRREARAAIAERIDSDATVAAFRAQLKEEFERQAEQRAVLAEIARLAALAHAGTLEQADDEKLGALLVVWEGMRS